MAKIDSWMNITDVIQQINTIVPPMVPDIVAASSGILKFARTTADQVVGNSTALTDATSLVVNVTPGTYYLKAVLGYNVTILAGVRQALGGTAGTSNISINHRLYNYSSAGLAAVSHISVLTTVLGAVSIGSSIAGEIEGILDITTSGTLKVQFANQAALGNTTLQTGSYLLYAKLN